MRECKTVGSLYLSMGDGGMQVNVLDDFGPTLEITTSAFGNLNQTTLVALTKEGLVALRDMIDKSLAHEFSESYCYSVKTNNTTQGCGSDGCCKEST